MDRDTDDLARLLHSLKATTEGRHRHRRGSAAHAQAMVQEERLIQRIRELIRAEDGDRPIA